MNICQKTPQHPMPLLGIGTWKLEGEECERVVRSALEMGYRHIDTAELYQNHEAISKATRSYARETLWITSKLHIQDLKASSVEPCTQKYLKELRMPYLDLLLIHWPQADMDLEAVVQSMLAIREKGLVKHIGVSNFSLSHFDELEKLGLLKEIYNHQLELHPYLQRRKIAQRCKESNISLTAYRPLAKGAFEDDPLLQEIGFIYGKTPSQIALNWIVSKGIAVIPKAASLEHLRENIESFDFEMRAQDRKLIETLDRGQRFCQPLGLMQFEEE